MAVAPIYVEAPSIQTAQFGLLDTIGTKSGDPHIGLGVQYQSEFCGTARAFEKPCDPPGTKTADDGVALVIGEPIPVYHLFQCRIVGSEDGSERARRSLDLGASRAVEAGFQTVFATGATDISPAGGTSDIVEGLALLEEYAGENYGAVPVIHMTRAAATRLISRAAVFRVGDHLETGLGSLVVAGAGYGGLDQPSAPAAGSGWMYATGAVTIWESKTIVTPMLQESPYANEFQALAERLYAPTFECFNAAVEVTEKACCP
jgi:hypothetical protein